MKAFGKRVGAGGRFAESILVVSVIGWMNLPSAEAVDLEKLASEPATIESVAMSPVPLEICEKKKGWIGIPKGFKSHNATIFKPERDQLGVAEFRVAKDGYVLLACNFDYQGNRSGDWVDTVLSKEEIRKMGWKEIRKPKKLGGQLVQQDGRVQTVFFKKVYRGEYFKLRCNKYDPPYPILLRRGTVFKMRGTRSWEDSGVRLREGESIEISAPDVNMNEGRMESLNGISAPVGSLLMKVGDRVYDIGMGGEIAPEGCGSVYLRSNLRASPNHAIEVSIVIK